MTLFRLFKDFMRDVKTWDASSRIALVLALILCVVCALMIAFAPVEWRQWGTIALLGLILITQLIVLWGNRGMITPYTKAQRHFMQGEFEEARTILEGLRDAGKADMRVLTLLGNTYRQLGMLDDSEIVLRQALDKESLHPFPLYGFGRTLLSRGNYHEAANTLEKALRAGTMVAQFDLGEIYYRLGDWQQAQQHLQAIRPSLQEPYRALMAEYLLYRMGVGTPPSSELIREGLPIWQENVLRFQASPYGTVLAEDIGALQALTEEKKA